MEGWPSGLRRRPAKALGRKARVGSNPTPSVEGAIRASGPPGRQGQECSNPRRPRSGMQSGFDSEPTEWAERSEARSAAAQSHSLRGGWSCGWPTADLDGWPSGLRRTIGNRVGESLRGFESHPVRQSSVDVFEPTHAAKQRVGRAERAERVVAKRPEGCRARPRARSAVNPTPSVVHPIGSGAWLSPVERCVRVAEVPGSNPGAPIWYPAYAGLFDVRPDSNGRFGPMAEECVVAMRPAG